MQIEQKELAYLRAVESQRAVLAITLTGIFRTPTKSEDEAKMKAAIASGIMLGMEHLGEGEGVEDHLEEVLYSAMEYYAKEQLEFERMKAHAEGREFPY